MEKTIEVLEQFIKQRHPGMNSIPIICPTMAHYILAKALEDEICKAELSIVPLVERVISLAKAIEKAPITLFNK